MWSCIGTGKEHLQSDQAIEAQVLRAVDNPHPAAAKDRFHFVAWYLWQVRPFERRGRFVGWREEDVKAGAELPDSPPLFADQRQQLWARLADLFRRHIGVKQFVQQWLEARIIDHAT
jgi:hypothetical protein